MIARLQACTRGTVLALCVGCAILGHARADEEANAPARMELRRAETEPAEGLVEATVLGTDRKVYLHKTAELTAKDIQNVRAGGDAQGKPTIEITFTAAGAKKMARLSRQHQGKPLAVMLGGKVLSAPTIRSEITRRAVVTGAFTAKQFERLLNAAGGADE